MVINVKNISYGYLYVSGRPRNVEERKKHAELRNTHPDEPQAFVDLDTLPPFEESPILWNGKVQWFAYDSIE